MMGKLIWLMGPSGSGKDSLLAELRLREQTQLLVAHRYITRDASAGSENHIALSEREFFTRARPKNIPGTIPATNILFTDIPVSTE